MIAPSRSDTFVDALLARIATDPDVLGLVLAGSSADTSRRDAWSDHDFLLVVVDGADERFRRDLSWLPDNDDFVFSFRETEHGLKVLYRDGLLLEFAVFTRDQFASCALNHYRVALDRADIATMAAEIHGRSAQPPRVDRLCELRSFLSLVYVGTGRARRGERLSASAMIRHWAVAHLLTLLRDLLPPEQTQALDTLDPWRRFEQAVPDVAADLDTAVTAPIEDVGRNLLLIADRELTERWDDYPRPELLAVADLLDWRIG